MACITTAAAAVYLSEQGEKVGEGCAQFVVTYARIRTY
jgi:hypothetical protein